MINIRNECKGELSMRTLKAGKTLNTDRKTVSIFQDRNPGSLTIAKFISSTKNVIEIDRIVNVFWWKICIQGIAGNGTWVIYLADSCNTKTKNNKEKD